MGELVGWGGLVGGVGWSAEREYDDDVLVAICSMPILFSCSGCPAWMSIARVVAWSSAVVVVLSSGLVVLSVLAVLRCPSGLLVGRVCLSSSSRSPRFYGLLLGTHNPLSTDELLPCTGEPLLFVTAGPYSLDFRTAT